MFERFDAATGQRVPVAAVVGAARVNILMVCTELAPIAKVGGLADAVSGLAHALGGRGHDVRVLLPRYGAPDIGDARPVNAAAPGGHHWLEIPPRHDDDPRVYLLNAPELFPDERIYTGDDPRDAARFLRLCDAALALGPSIAWHPDIFHFHDWQTAPLALLARSPGAPPEARRACTVLSLHNIAFQGTFARSVALTALDHPALEPLIERSSETQYVNLLRAAIEHADAITTVSPTYAKEIQTPEQGMGLDDVLRARAADLHGILNGVDYRFWEPSTDALIGHNYDARDPAPKRRIKAELGVELGLAGNGSEPLIGLVSRLTWQKGIDLLLEAMPPLLEDTDARFALLGAGEAPLAEKLREIARSRPGRVGFVEGYDEALAHRILAGSDLVLLPSRYEPCGLTQLYALRYGTIPVVRATGGLADTVQPFDPAAGTGHGSVFGPYEPRALIAAVRRALEWFAAAPIWRQVMANAMRTDFSWHRQAEEYEAVYRRLLE